MLGNRGKGLTKLEAVLAVLFVIALVAAGASWAIPRPAEVRTTTVVSTVTETVGAGEVITTTVTQAVTETVEKTVTKTLTVG